MRILRFINGLLDRLFLVIGAFLGSQIPQFMQQYTQRLAGHVEELHYLIDQLNRTASSSHKTLDQYIYKFLSNSDPDFKGQGLFMQTVVERWNHLTEALRSITESSVWTRPYAILAHWDHEIIKGTFHSFEPGLSLTLEGLYYGGLGMLMGFLFYQLMAKFIKSMTSKKKVEGVQENTFPSHP